MELENILAQLRRRQIELSDKGSAHTRTSKIALSRKKSRCQLCFTPFKCDQAAEAR